MFQLVTLGGKSIARNEEDYILQDSHFCLAACIPIGPAPVQILWPRSPTSTTPLTSLRVQIAKFCFALYPNFASVFSHSRDEICSSDSFACFSRLLFACQRDGVSAFLLYGSSIWARAWVGFSIKLNFEVGPYYTGLFCRFTFVAFACCSESPFAGKLRVVKCIDICSSEGSRGGVLL